MTEAEWLACNDRVKLFESLTTPSDRKCILFAAQCCLNGVEYKLSRRERSKSHQRWLASMKYADGECELARLRRAWGHPFPYEAPCFAEDAQNWARAWGLDEAHVPPDSDELVVATLKDVFDYPFAPVRVDLRWLSSTALGLGHAIYDDLAFDRLPILADALQDAGCEDDRILNHLRGGGLHVKGCWALDLVLGKS